MTLVRISEGSLLQLLCADLMDSGDLIVEIIDDDTAEVDLLGSYGAEEMTVAVEARLRAWEAKQQARGVAVSLEIFH